MQGFQITFFTQQDRRHKGKPVAEWLLELCRTLGIRGATSFVGTQGIGHNGRYHSHHFFELADQPVEVTMAVAASDAKRLFTEIKKSEVRLFYIKSEVEFGTLGEDG
jgi:PII-like signaling protein